MHLIQTRTSRRDTFVNQLCCFHMHIICHIHRGSRARIAGWQHSFAFSHCTARVFPSNHVQHTILLVCSWRHRPGRSTAHGQVETFQEHVHFPPCVLMRVMLAAVLSLWLLHASNGRAASVHQIHAESITWNSDHWQFAAFTTQDKDSLFAAESGGCTHA